MIVSVYVKRVSRFQIMFFQSLLLLKLHLINDNDMKLLILIIRQLSKENIG